MLEANKQFVRQFFAAMDAKRFDEMEAMLHPNHLFHFPLAKAPLDKTTHVIMNKQFQEAFPIIDRVFEDQIAESNQVATRGRMRLQHVGEFQGIQPTQQVITITFIHVMRIEDGLNAEEWDEANFLPLLKALGQLRADAEISFDA